MNLSTIGVILTPTAKMYFRGELPEFVVEYRNIQFKRNMKTLDLCINWSFEDEKCHTILFRKKGIMCLKLHLSV